MRAFPPRLSLPYSFPPSVAASSMPVLSATPMCAQGILTLFLDAGLFRPFSTLDSFSPTKVLDPVFSLSAIHAIVVSYSSATFLIVHFHSRPNLY